MYHARFRSAVGNPFDWLFGSWKDSLGIMPGQQDHNNGRRIRSLGFVSRFSYEGAWASESELMELLLPNRPAALVVVDDLQVLSTEDESSDRDYEFILLRNSLMGALNRLGNVVVLGMCHIASSLPSQACAHRQVGKGSEDGSSHTDSARSHPRKSNSKSSKVDKRSELDRRLALLLLTCTECT
jgi:hypothetical protein